MSSVCSLTERLFEPLPLGGVVHQLDEQLHRGVVDGQLTGAGRLKRWADAGRTDTSEKGINIIYTHPQLCWEVE